MNDALQKTVFASGMKQYRIAAQAKVSESRFSKILNGRADPTPDEQKRIARALKRPVAELFGAVA